ncbi:GGDEF domain-containing protein [Halofilum ochraceum]|uniref:GGDEF domain-containing protein n=1 Tax=Halofilum ochraceum TaxID=1611323 RepID=UPI0008D9B7F0|nr:GGDEF domain-containing protein [Halofilum ochraceum]
MTQRRFRVLLLAGYLGLFLATAVAMTQFVAAINQHIGSDYTAAASNIVRGQHEAAKLRHATERYLANPGPALRDRILRTFNTIESREGTTRNSFDLLGLDTGTRETVVAEFERVIALLPRARELSRQALDDPAAREEFREVAMEVENSLAFVYSSLHRQTHAASAAQQRLTTWLAWAVIALGGLLLVIIAALLWAVDAVFGKNKALKRLSLTDVLTDLPNRRGLLQRVEQTLAQHRRNGRPVSLALLDLDHFKIVNDHEGHPKGDAVLQHIAGEIAQSVRATDMLARLGGEEFGLLMPETGEEGAYHLCERIRQRIEEMELPMTSEVKNLTLSVGVTTVTVDAETSFEPLYVAADRALYEAKRQGRNHTVAQT